MNVSALRLLGLLLPLLGIACSDPRASLKIDTTAMTRDTERRVVVDVELTASEGLGGNIGAYCVRVTFAGQSAFREQCAADLEDGDRKKLRFVSDGAVPPQGAIFVRIRHNQGEDGRSLVGPS